MTDTVGFKSFIRPVYLEEVYVAYDWTSLSYRFSRNSGQLQSLLEFMYTNLYVIITYWLIKNLELKLF